MFGINIVLKAFCFTINKHVCICIVGQKGKCISSCILGGGNQESESPCSGWLWVTSHPTPWSPKAIFSSFSTKAASKISTILFSLLLITFLLSFKNHVSWLLDLRPKKKKSIEIYHILILSMSLPLHLQLPQNWWILGCHGGIRAPCVFFTKSIHTPQEFFYTPCFFVVISFYSIMDVRRLHYNLYVFWNWIYKFNKICIAPFTNLNTRLKYWKNIM